MAVPFQPSGSAQSQEGKDEENDDNQTDDVDDTVHKTPPNRVCPINRTERSSGF
jgi:hypothetical protein